ncbi:CHAT domain-containing protein [Nonomuraea sp. NPDC050556]|uniref:CHAT domain-containing protein n=1 Tax=Nonomuraea sp. NPDC050556 TaxID=3364369 RepID=UPI00379DCA7A
MTGIVGVHGTGAYAYLTAEGTVEAAAGALAAEWSALLGHRPVTMSFYAHHLHRGVRQGTDELTAGERRLLIEWVDQLHERRAVPMGPSQDRGRARQAAEWLARSKGPEERDRALEFVRETAVYLDSPARRERAREEVAATIARERPYLVVAHSLGSVVAYEALWAHPELQVDLLVTTGSPLGLDPIFERLGFGRGAKPPGVDTWINRSDPDDIIAFPADLRDRFDGVDAQEEKTGTGGAAAGYLPPMPVIWTPVSPPSVAPDPPEPSRLLTGQLPARASVGDEVSLIVRVVLDASETPGSSAPLKPFAVPYGGLEVSVVAQASSGLAPLDRTERTLLVPHAGDSEPVRFPYAVGAVGLQRVDVTVWAGGTFLGELALELSAETSAPPAAPATRSAPMGGPHPVSGEVTLQVRRSPDGYVFQLLSEGNLYDPVLQSLAGDPSGAVEQAIASLHDLARGAGDSLWLREAGVNLWDQMVPQAVKEQFWELRGDIRAFSIATDHDIIPWELLHPLSERDDAGFLVEQFPVTRRVYGQARARALRLRDPGFVLAGQPPPEAVDEVKAINRLVTGGRLFNRRDDLATFIRSGDSGLLHFACHNSFDARGSSIAMLDGDFGPVHLSSAVTTRALRRGSPLVFFNACRSAGAVYEYTRMVGWAGAFMRAGAGAFVGTLWAVPSGRARRFAEEFYGAFVEDRQPLGEATRLARLGIRQGDDPTWLAYTCYGDPYAIIAP